MQNLELFEKKSNQKDKDIDHKKYEHDLFDDSNKSENMQD